jgi:hypothetical protein
MKKIFLLLSLISTVNAFAQVPSYVPTSGLVAWYPFDGNANDGSGNGYDGTVIGATLTTDRFGNPNSAYLFDGSNSQITTTVQSGFAYHFTISAWIKTFDVAGTGHQAEGIFCARNAYDHINSLQIDGGGNGVMVDIDDNVTLSQSISTGGIGIDNNEWRHVVGVYDSNTVIIYLDDTVRVNAGVSTWLIQVINPFIIGYDNSTGSTSNRYFDGKIDDIGCWNRALSSGEIKTLFQSCSISFSTQPSNQNIIPGNGAQFIVAVTDGNATYQWQTDIGLGFQNLSNAGQYNGVNNDTLTVSNVSVSNANQNFRCIISSGSCIDTSQTAVLTINTTEIHELISDNRFTIYPNPANDFITVKVSSLLLNKTYSVSDPFGKIILTGKIANENTTVNLNELAAGFYFFKMAGEERSFKALKR